MEKLRLEVPSIERKEEAISYIEEFLEYNSEINGTGGLDRYLDNYEDWLIKIEEDIKPTEERVPARTYFLVRNVDNKIVGMINIRLVLNEKLKYLGGNIGYSIRPTERKKGYNKINLYLGLQICQNYGIKEIYLDCNKNNPASAKTMLALGANLVKEWYDDTYYNTIIQKYIINVDESLEKYKDVYEEYVIKEENNKVVR